MVQAKAPLPPPMADDRVFPTVSFRHPAYPDYESEFMLLSAVDGDDLGDGLDYDTAFLACCIAAGNKWHAGWLAEKHRDSFSPVDVPEDRILRGDKYYLMMNGFSPNCKSLRSPSLIFY